ncbi:hypothetical protein [Ruminococcus sp.]|uniref:hypothetical protein n=1 Tax=Ruminococcus sp. TaxID=41978 RepID=UPI00265F02B1|nr:hypothetical protein [Ruminococcus sp.]MEE1396782.1 hypothetical protein [Ruminococcus sp.]
MNAIDLLKKKVKGCYGLVEFAYQGKDGNIDPYFHEDGTYSYLLYFDGHEKMVYSIEDVMNTPFILGKSLYDLKNDVDLKVID